MPVCLTVIPNVYGDTRVYWKDGNPHDPAIPPAHRGSESYYSILDYPQLCAFLNDLAVAGLVEICLPDLPPLTGFGVGAIDERQMLYVCDDYLFNYQRYPAESLRVARAALAQNDLTIISNHYWMFYHPWRPEPNRPDIAAWNSLLDTIMDAEDWEITSFGALALRGSASCSR